MAHRTRNSSYEQYTDEKKGLMVVSVLAFVFLVGVGLIIHGLAS